MAKEIKPSKHLEDFLNFLDQCVREYQYAFDNMSKEDKRLQDLLHEIEFAADKAEKNRAATSLQRSRRERRKNKDMVKLYERIVKFSEDQSNRRTIPNARSLASSPSDLEVISVILANEPIDLTDGRYF